MITSCGGMGERLKPAVLKTVSPARGSGVRIPLPPPAYLPLFQLVNDIGSAVHHWCNLRFEKLHRITRPGIAHVGIKLVLHRVDPRKKCRSVMPTLL